MIDLQPARRRASFRAAARAVTWGRVWHRHGANDRRGRRLALAAIGLLTQMGVVLTGCATLAGEHARKWEPWCRAELYLGRETGDGGQVSLSDFHEFVDDQLADELPGMTIFMAEGRYLEDEIVQREETFVVSVLFPESTKEDALRTIEAAAGEYARRFDQDFVLVEHMPTRVRFVDSDPE